MENLQRLQTRASIKGPHGQPERDYERDNDHSLLFFFGFYSTAFMIVFGVNTSDTLLCWVVRFTTTLKWTNSRIHEELWELDLRL